VLGNPEDLKRREFGDPDDLRPKQYCDGREASRRSTGMRHFDVQLIGGLVLHQARLLR